MNESLCRGIYGKREGSRDAKSLESITYSRVDRLRETCVVRVGPPGIKTVKSV